MSRRTLALAAALALAGTLVFPSAAAPLLGGPSDDVGGGVELLPATDSEYATVGPDGDLALDLTPGDVGLNPGSVTTFGDVFYVRYAGDRHAEVWVTTDSAAVSFAVAGQPADSRAERVRVGPDEVVPVTVTVDTTGGDVAVDDVTVHTRVADGGSEGTQASAETTPDDSTAVSVPAVQRRATGSDSLSFTMLAPTEGEPVTLDTDRMVVAGTRDRAASLESVAVTPASGDAMTVDVARTAATAAGPVPGAAADALGALRVDASTDVDAATFRMAIDDAFLEDVAADAGDLALYRQSGGEWSEVALSVVAEREGGVVVEGTTPGFSTFVLAAERPAIGVSEASVSPSSVSATDAATVTATVTNDGGAAGERTVSVTVGGEVVAERSVALDAGESATLTVSVAPGPGEHAIAVDGVDAGELVVAANDGGDSAGDASDESGAESVAADSGDDPLDEPAGFDFGTLAAAGLAVALVVVSVAVLRRWRGGAE
jgi:hypothetical protein